MQKRFMSDSCYLLSIFRPINVSCHLLTSYYFPALVLWHPRHQSKRRSFVDITRDSMSLYDYMSSRAEVYCKSNLAIDRFKVIQTVCLITGRLPNCDEIRGSLKWRR
jgi:hypothetical protein